jgi:hypothetical protein
MTLEQLKDLLSTYGVNDDERNAPVFVVIEEKRTPILLADSHVEYGTWDEDAHAWVGDQLTVLLQAGEAVAA